MRVILQAKAGFRHPASPALPTSCGSRAASAASEVNKLDRRDPQDSREFGHRRRMALKGTSKRISTALVSMLLLLPLLLCSSSSFASEVELWTEVGLRYKVNKRLRLGFDQHFRFDEKVSRVQSIMPEVTARYRLFKFLRLKAGYRLLGKPQYSESDTYYDVYHRFFFDVNLRHNVKPLRLKYRLRLQEQLGWPYELDGSSSVLHTIRNKLGIEWRTGIGLAPFLSGELLARFGDETKHKWRATLGTDFLSSNHVLTGLYRMEGTFDDEEDPTTHIFGLAYHFRL